MSELVSIVTPTMRGREEVLLERCIPSVQTLNWIKIEHIIVSDSNPQLASDVAAQDFENVTFVQLNDTWRNPMTEASVGAIPWYIGTMLAQGEFVGFLGDDDAVLPQHVKLHVEAMKRDQAMFSISRVQFIVRGNPVFVIGDNTFQHGHLDATGIMCHRDALCHANWTANGENAADYRLVRDWQAKGLVGTFVDAEPTVHHHDGWAA